MGVVLVHGGGFAGSCWDPMLPFLEEPAVAVDLPGRGARAAADLSTSTLADFVAAVVEDIERSGWDDVLLVGHSLAGITLPAVAAAVPDRLRRLVFVSCTVPAEGGSTLDTLDPDVRRLAEAAPEQPRPTVLDEGIARAMFCTDMDEDQARWTLDHMVAEAPAVIAQAVTLEGLRHPIPRTWVRLLADAVIPAAKQDGFVATIGGADVVDLDAGHMAMISRPRELAAILNGL